ncbi:MULTISPECIES: manganese efflux pump MntP family protein [Gammaproteobacteria]|uniref:manganese efflux pump MntP n=1 Tax=Gammaproteobacteria TaxID=1236 RepID=UPI000DCFC86F|nr:MULTISPECIES: manganese efflux pump MntP family protein [Gammaproteobacteria]RTE86720.1 manganese efflux pump MntP family protein [Aliidiomarina sp. B3213]TCZ90726.1 manganese efflux pump MntP family protein [Lysobacter sp. N42]
MSFIALILIAFAMSTDAFAAAIGKGTKLHKPTLVLALKTGLVFGVIEGLTPVIGWFIGHAAASYVEAFDHWIAFALLAGLGVHIIYEGLQPVDDSEQSPVKRQSLGLVVLTAVGTSIDAMAVGVGLAFVEVNIALAATLIGFATFLMVTLGVMLGSVLGSVFGKRAEVFGGFVLIGVGTSILVSHIYAV